MNIKKSDNFKNYINQATVGIMVLLIYFILPKLQGIPFYVLGVDTKTVSRPIIYAYLIIWETLTLSLILLLFNKSIKKNIEDMKKNHLFYFKKYIKYWIYALVIMMISNAIIMQFNGGSTSGNEEIIRDLFVKSPIYIYISSVFFAPIIEELVFRKAIYNIIPNKILFILVSGLVFGGLHVIGNVESLVDLLYLIPYCTPGFIFAYIMSDTDNVFVSSGLHFMHNGILMSLQFIVLFFS